MDETQVTTMWMAGVVLMMLVFAAFAITGYFLRKTRKEQVSKTP